MPFLQAPNVCEGKGVLSLLTYLSSQWQDRRQAKGSAHSLPVVGTPFERVEIDIVGPLDPSTASGNQFILVIVDHATRYPEAIPLRTETAR